MADATIHLQKIILCEQHDTSKLTQICALIDLYET